jgi:murein DD-endopeptidase
VRSTSIVGISLGVAILALTGCSTLPRQSAGSVAVGERAAEYALDMKGRPYRYGGNTPRGFDCSGLIQYSYARAGVRLPRTTRGLWRSSSRISASRLRPGDLLFFNQQGKRSSHVALYIGHGRFVHAPSTGKRVSVGSVNSRYWHRHLDSARRLHIY